MRALAFLSLFLLVACAGPPEAQSGLPVETVVIETARGPVRLAMELADTVESQQRGLMYRKQMAADAGMLFVFPRPRVATFWMRNTYLPLDMIFVRSNGTVASIAPNVKILSDARTSSTEPVLAVIEINAGRAAQLGIVPGSLVRARALGNSVP